MQWVAFHAWKHDTLPFLVIPLCFHATSIEEIFPQLLYSAYDHMSAGFVFKLNFQAFPNARDAILGVGCVGRVFLRKRHGVRRGIYHTHTRRMGSFMRASEFEFTFNTYT